MPPYKKKIRVLIVEDSAVVRNLLEYIVNNDERMEVAAAVPSAEEALQILPSLRPDIISMDVNLPGMDGLAATHRIMTEQPTPLMIVSSSVTDSEAQTSLEALRAGALTVAEKPVGINHPQFEQQARQLCNKLVIMSEISVVRQKQGRYLRPVSATDTIPQKVMPRPVPVRTSTELYRLLGVVVSTGGPQALVRLFNDLGGDFPLPVLLIQHITPAFIESFARWLGSVCPFSVVIADEGTIPIPGHIYIAPADCHLQVGRGIGGRYLIHLDDSPPVSGQKPSGTKLFASMADANGQQSIGVLLTGMGEDGAEGLLTLRNAGGYTIAEDQSTAVVYGMPAVAINRGAVIQALPLPEIGNHIRSLIPQYATAGTEAKGGNAS